MAKWLVIWMALILCVCPGQGGGSVFEYPTAILDLYDADESCWVGTNASGGYPVAVIPRQWLVGAPPSEVSAVTIPADHWMDLGFSGRLVGGDGDDLLLVETGKAGEQALLFVTDGGDREYLLTKVVIETAMRQELSDVGVDLDGIALPFVPRAVRLVGLDMGGQSPGFDLGSVQARVSHDCGVKAGCPNPISGARGVEPGVRLSWSPGASASGHQVYWSDSASEVRAGAAAVAYPPQPGDANTFDPPGLELGKTYYWRVDELGPAGGDAVHVGDVWSLTVADHVTIDDFESYIDGPAVWRVWQRGGDADVALEREILDTCQQSIAFSYHYDNASHSILSRYFDTVQDWTRGGARVLQLLLHGDLPDPASGKWYIALTDGVNSQIVPQPAVVDIEDKPPWRVCRIALADLGEVDLTQVRGMIVGVRPLSSLGPGISGGGTLNIAEIGLYGPSCPPASPLRADLAADCRVDYRDLDRMAKNWLHEPTRVHEVALPKDPVLWYEFDGNAHDRMGRAHGQVLGRCNFVPGVYGQAIHFISQGDAVVIPQAADAFAEIREAVTIAFWQKGEDSGHLNDTLVCSNYIYGQSNPAIAIHLGCWRNPGRYRWDCGFPWSFDNRLAGRHREKSHWTGRWNHWAFTKDIRTGPDGAKGSMEIYLNGELYDRMVGTETPITGVTSLQIGSGWYGHYDGLIDDVQIYDYALSTAEIAYVATDGAGIFEKPSVVADLNGNDLVDFKDFAVLAAQWLRTGAWP
jgi:hypothetical protein